MRKEIITSFILSLVAFFAMTAQNVPAVRSAVLQSISPVHGASAPVAVTVKHITPVVPLGSQTYQIMESAGPGPHIVQATIDPPDVHVGNVQNFTVIVSSAAKPSSVVAFVGTDHGTTTVTLTYAGLAQTGDLLPARYVLNDAGNIMPTSDLATGDSGNPFVHIVASVFGRPAVSSAATAQAEQKYRFEGSWTVRDTHNIYYRTTFVATDPDSKQDSVTLAWSDACGIPQSGSVTVSSACSIVSTDGVQGGNLIVASATLTISSSATVFAYSPGNSITIGTGGKIVIASGAAIKKGYLYYASSSVASGGYVCGSTSASTTPLFSVTSSLSGYTYRSSTVIGTEWPEYWDTDNDGYGDGGESQMCAGNSQPSSADPGYAFDKNDCDDTSANAYPGSSYWGVTPDNNIWGPGGSWDYNCNGTVQDDGLPAVSWISGGGSCNMSSGADGNGSPSCGVVYDSFYSAWKYECTGSALHTCGAGLSEYDIFVGSSGTFSSSTGGCSVSYDAWYPYPYGLGQEYLISGTSSQSIIQAPLYGGPRALVLQQSPANYNAGNGWAVVACQ